MSAPANIAVRKTSDPSMKMCRPSAERRNPPDCTALLVPSGARGLSVLQRESIGAATAHHGPQILRVDDHLGAGRASR